MNGKAKNKNKPQLKGWHANSQETVQPWRPKEKARVHKGLFQKGQCHKKGTNQALEKQ